MSVEVLLLALACGMTILAYMIAINAHGPTRLSLSYLMATIMLAGTVWGIVQYVNTDLDSRKMEELKRLETEKKIAEARIQSQEEALRANKERMGQAAKLNTIIATGTGLASAMINIDLQDRGVAGTVARADAHRDVACRAQGLANEGGQCPTHANAIDLNDEVPTG